MSRSAKGEPLVNDGDSLTVSATEEVKYEGARIYLKYEANINVQPGEGFESAQRRAATVLVSGMDDIMTNYFDWKDSK